MDEHNNFTARKFPNSDEMEEHILHILFNESWLGQNLQIRLLLGIWSWNGKGPKIYVRIESK
jgi:hypothetical protein